MKYESDEHWGPKFSCSPRLIGKVCVKECDVKDISATTTEKVIQQDSFQ